MTTYLTNKLPDETVLASVDFGPRLPAGVTITDCSTAISTYSGSDDHPEHVVNGVLPTASGSVVSQMVTAGIVGVHYMIVFAAVLSDGETMEEQRVLRVVAFN